MEGVFTLFVYWVGQSLYSPKFFDYTSCAHELNTGIFQIQKLHYHHPRSIISIIHLAHLSIENQVSDREIRKAMQLERLKIQTCNLNEDTSALMEEIPLNKRTLWAKLSLDFNPYDKICCSTCFHLTTPEEHDYLPNKKNKSLPIKPIPICSQILLANHGNFAIFNAELYSKNKNTSLIHPAKQFHHQSLINWI